MALDPTRKNAIRERLRFYRELGIGPLYRREVSADSQAENPREESLESMAPVADVVSGDQGQAAPEAYLLPGDDRKAKLRVILDDIGPNCQRCKLAKLGRKQIVFGAGDPNAELMFIGEGPGADEDEQGLPFVGRTGQLLNNMITAMGLK